METIRSVSHCAEPRRPHPRRLLSAPTRGQGELEASSLLSATALRREGQTQHTTSIVVAPTPGRPLMTIPGRLRSRRTKRTRFAKPRKPSGPWCSKTYYYCTAPFQITPLCTCSTAQGLSARARPSTQTHEVDLALSRPQIRLFLLKIQVCPAKLGLRGLHRPELVWGQYPFLHCSDAVCGF